jgi:hypothetical protein
MLNTKLIKKVEKRLGVKVEQTETGRYYVHYDKNVISWLTQGPECGQGLGYDGPDAYAMNFHIRRVNDHSDPQTDYFAGYHVDNASQMLNSICPPKPKYKVGDLVRFKDCKRQKRYGNAGLTGLIVDTCGDGKHYDVSVPGSITRTYIADRDLEVLAAA